MKVTEFSQPVTSKKLNESLAKTFGYKINLEQFTNEQLEDARNRLRTKVSQFEMKESYSAVYENSDYQKTKMFLDVINQEIAERGDLTTITTDDNSMKTRTTESTQWIDSAKLRLTLGEDTEEDLVDELLVRYDLSESQATRLVRNLSIIVKESEEDKAAIIMASKDMVDRITGWLEDVAAMKAEQLLELLDSIRDQLGSEKSEAFSSSVKPALENLYSTLESSRTTLMQGVGILTGQETGPAPTMGAEPVVPGEEAAVPGEEAFPTGDDFAASEPATGGEEAAGRAKRESIEYSRKLGMMLASKKK
jgi:hypothetical protein